ncbi:MAG TPA: hypothetical protein VFH51_18180 [Myxococcota bacterium]|nr:hypothetical protein [Myxococcota bacterium]
MKPAKALFATGTQVTDRWHVRINLEAAPFHPASQHPPGAPMAEALSIDRGLGASAVAMG